MVGARDIFIPKPFDFCSKGLKIFICFVLCFYKIEVYGQFEEKEDSLSPPINWQKQLYQHNYTLFGLGSFMMGGYSTLDKGEIQLNPVLGWGHYLSLIYGFSLSQNFSIETGLTYGTHPIHFAYFIPAEKYNLVWDFDVNTKRDRAPFEIDLASSHFGYLAFPFRLVSRSRLSQKLYGNVKLGINFRYIGFSIMGYSYGSGCLGCYQNPDKLLIIAESYTQLIDRFKLTYDFAVGLSYQLKNHDLIDFNLVANLSPYRVINGTYTFFPNEPDLQQFRSEGTYYSYANYLGFEISYTFTKAGKIARRIKKDARKAWRRFNR